MILGISGFSLFWAFGIVSIIGLIFGIIALNRVNKSGGVLKGKGFAITGIVTSAAGLALVLTIIGVWLFINSATTFSLRKKLRMQSEFALTAQEGVKPGIEGWVCIINDKDNPERNCLKPLFTPRQVQSENELVISDMRCGPRGKESIKVSWQYINKENKADVYDFRMTMLVDEDFIGTSEKVIVYNGTEQVIFEDARRKIFIKSKK